MGAEPPSRCIQAGTFRTDAGAILGPVPWILWRSLAEGELDENRRLLQALNCLLVETPAGRVLIETGIGERLDDKNRAMREYGGTPVVPSLREAGFDPGSVDVVAMSHLHFDHAGGLLHADGTKAFPGPGSLPSARSGRSRSASNTRLVASYDQPELRLVADWGAEGWAEGERGSCCRGSRSSVPAATPRGTRPWWFVGPVRARARWPSSATCACGRGPRTRAG